MMSVASSDSGGAYVTGISSSLDLQHANTETALPETLRNDCPSAYSVEKERRSSREIRKCVFIGMKSCLCDKQSVFTTLSSVLLASVVRHRLTSTSREDRRDL